MQTSKILKFCLSTVVLLSILVGSLLALGIVKPFSVAADTVKCPSSQDKRNADCKSNPSDVGNCSSVNNPDVPCVTHNKIITGVVQPVVNFLSALIGIIVVGVIITGGIQYSLAGGNPEAVSKARKRISNGIVALAIFIFLFAFVEWLIPGGVFK